MAGSGAAAGMAGSGGSGGGEPPPLIWPPAEASPESNGGVRFSCAPGGAVDLKFLVAGTNDVYLEEPLVSIDTTSSSQWEESYWLTDELQYITHYEVADGALVRKSFRLELSSTPTEEAQLSCTGTGVDMLGCESTCSMNGAKVDIDCFGAPSDVPMGDKRFWRVTERLTTFVQLFAWTECGIGTITRYYEPGSWVPVAIEHGIAAGGCTSSNLWWKDTGYCWRVPELAR